MSKTLHPARRARNLTGAVSALALVGMVTSFQLAAAANEADSSAGGVPAQTATTAAPSQAPAEQAPAEASPAEPVPAQEVVVVVDSAPAPAVVDPAPAPAAPAPAPAPAPPSGTTAGS